MPTLEKTERVSSFHQKLTFTIADLNLLDPKLNFSAAITDGILKGNWRLSIGRDTSKGAQQIKIHFDHSQISTGALGKDIVASFKFSCIAEDQTLILIESSIWDSCPELPDPKYTGISSCIGFEDLQATAIRAGGVYEPDTHRRYSVEFGLRSVTSMEPEKLAISQSRKSCSLLSIRFNCIDDKLVRSSPLFFAERHSILFDTLESQLRALGEPGIPSPRFTRQHG